MRKVFAMLFIALDGVVESPEKWQFGWDDKMDATLHDNIAGQDTALLGRVTFEEWATYWPVVEQELVGDRAFADFINSRPKYIASRSLTNLDDFSWQNSILIQGDVADTIADLKQQEGKDIGVHGSPTLMRYLFDNDLLDELQLWIHPTVAGQGRRLFGDENVVKRLQFVESKTTPTGVVIATYKRYTGDDTGTEG